MPDKLSSALLAHNYLALAIFVYTPFFHADINKRFIYLGEVTLKLHLHRRRIDAYNLPHDAIIKSNLITINTLLILTYQDESY
jgi:hypothetical protein